MMLAVSLLVHCLAIVLLFAIRFSSALPSFSIAPQHFTLLAPPNPAPIARPVARPTTQPMPQELRPRQFHPLPQAPAHLEIPAPLIPAPPIDIAKPALPEIPRAAAPVVVVPATHPTVKPSGFVEPKSAAALPAPKPVVKNSGFESADNPAAAPARVGLSGVGSFDSSSSRPAAARRTVVTGAAFGDTTVERGVAQLKSTAVAARLTPVEILSKPKPAYSAEARAKGIEGEVLLEVQFTVAGDVRILRVVRGLGHGLDENAIAAAMGIRFRPATRDGAPVESSALVHIVFELAN